MKMKNTANEFVVAACVALAAVFACQGALSVKFGSAMEVEIDGEVQTFANNAVWEPPAKAPCIYRMRPVLASGQRTFSIKGDDATGSDGGTYRFPQYGEGNWVRVALGGDSQATRYLTSTMLTRSMAMTTGTARPITSIAMNRRFRRKVRRKPFRLRIMVPRPGAVLQDSLLCSSRPAFMTKG